MIDLLKKNGPWFKANLHCHTTFSDGKMTAAQVKEHYKSNGYSIVAYTDHSKFAWYPELQDKDFLPVAGVETAFTCLDLNNKPLKYKLCHINFWAKDPANAEYIPEEPTYEVGVINRYIAAMKKKGWLCGLNHPAWSRQTTEEINGITGIDTFEVYNHGSQYLDNNGDGQNQYSMYLSEGKRAWCVSVDDNHAGFMENGEICDADDTLGGYIMMSMPELSYENFADALENGRFYASSGPQFQDLYIDEERDVLVMNCGPVQRVLVKGIHTVKCERINAKGDIITHAEIPLAPIRAKEPFIHVQIMDSKGNRAYAQPYWFD